MSRKREIPVKKRLSYGGLRKQIKNGSDNRLLQRLCFIMALYEGDSVKEASRKVGVVKSTGYNWLHRWNDDGLEGLRPDFGGGRPPKLSYKAREKLREALEEKHCWTTREAGRLIREEYGVEYSMSHLRRILRVLGMRYGKPRQKDYRRPLNAEEELKESVNHALKDEKGFIFGFFDETAPQTNSNSQRVWSFGKPEIVKNTTRYRANTFGFYSLNGESVIGFKENSKAESVCKFMEEIWRENRGEKIFMVLDNFPSHRAKKTMERAEDLGIGLIYLPPYSPDLNPIEQIWKSLKREISTAFFKTKEEFLRLIKTTFKKLSEKISYCAGWIKKFLPEKFKKLCH